MLLVTGGAGFIGSNVVASLDEAGCADVAVSDILGTPTRMNAEDFIAISKDGRLVTVNAKAAVAARSTRVRDDGFLTPARHSAAQAS